MKMWAGHDWKPEWFYKDLLKFDDPHKRWKGAFLDKQILFANQITLINY